MDKELKAKWIDALRSGKYKKGKRQLFVPYEGSYCCLGVLAHMQDPSSIDDKGSAVINDKDYNATVYLPYVFKDIIPLNDEKMLARINDSSESFIEVIDYIECNL